MPAERTIEEISYEMFMLLRRQRKVRDEYDRVTRRMRDVEKEVLTHSLTVGQEDTYVPPVSTPGETARFIHTGDRSGETLRLNPIGDTLMNLMSVKVKFAEDALAGKDQSASSTSSEV